MSNQYESTLEQVTSNDNIFYRVSLMDGDDTVFLTTLIPARYKLAAQMIHSTLETAIAFGMLKSETQD